MSVLSKDVMSAIQGSSCQEVLHPWTGSCWKAFFRVFVPSCGGVAHFFLAIYATKILMKGKHVSRAYLKRQVKDFGWSYLYGLCVAAFLVRGLCITRYLLEGFYYNFSITIPGFITGLAIFVETPRMKSIHAVTFSTGVLEALVRYSVGEKYITRTPTTDTLCFMAFNSILMYLMKANQTQHSHGFLWYRFFTPSSSTESARESNRLQTWHMILKGAMKYFWTGYGIQIFKVIVSKIALLGTHKYKRFFLHLLNKKAFNFGLFLLGYVSLYKIVMYELYKSRGEEKLYDSAIAGLVAGAPYSLSRKLSIGVMPLTIILQILWRKLNKSGKFDRWRIQEIYYACLMGTLLHFRAMLPEYCPIYVDNMINIGTWGRIYLIINSFNKLAETTQKKLAQV